MLNASFLIKKLVCTLSLEQNDRSGPNFLYNLLHHIHNKKKIRFK